MFYLFIYFITAPPRIWAPSNKQTNKQTTTTTKYKFFFSFLFWFLRKYLQIWFDYLDDTFIKIEFLFNCLLSSKGWETVTITNIKFCIHLHKNSVPVCDFQRKIIFKVHLSPVAEFSVSICSTPKFICSSEYGIYLGY